MYLLASAFCQAIAPHNNARVFPEPVGLSRRQFWARWHPRMICDKKIINYILWIAKNEVGCKIEYYFIHHWNLGRIRFSRKFHLDTTNRVSNTRWLRKNIGWWSIHFQKKRKKKNSYYQRTINIITKETEHKYKTYCRIDIRTIFIDILLFIRFFL